MDGEEKFTAASKGKDATFDETLEFIMGKKEIAGRDDLMIHIEVWDYRLINHFKVSFHSKPPDWSAQHQPPQCQLSPSSNPRVSGVPVLEQLSTIHLVVHSLDNTSEVTDRHRLEQTQTLEVACMPTCSVHKVA